MRRSRVVVLLLIRVSGESPVEGRPRHTRRSRRSVWTALHDEARFTRRASSFAPPKVHKACVKLCATIVCVKFCGAEGSHCVRQALRHPESPPPRTEASFGCNITTGRCNPH